MLTFVRPGELRKARWDEFDLEQAEWVIPINAFEIVMPEQSLYREIPSIGRHEGRDEAGGSIMFFETVINAEEGGKYKEQAE